ncbi:MAG TPA: molecular chaperone DnaK [Thermotogota bacterium]|jgi:molecular chaperone DnaK|nr:molecular chaperone DnaK [Thermotogota bacterium]OQC30157.1 MAG: Chaperone protein DnaK [Thermotogota bacterium ADurb.Bin062]HNW47494.1 molecular chaperone DnaK [Thermotogota bacterium]HNY83110.1 molecular chaperone DnaK [Thermotogota bacterium]HOD91982.1 molecular chaperone DnaK [Thermotogota bacterium]
MAKEFVVGIDLGTTNSVIAWVKPDKTSEVISNAEGSRTTSSVVSFSKTGEIIVGEPAKRQAVLNSDRTIRSIKRKMGTDTKNTIDGKDYTPQEISSYILRKMVKDAEAYLGGTIKKAVITCPAYFNDAQRQATKEAGQIAGLEVLRIINEPTAAALAYGLDRKNDEKVVVFDLGGGTFDVSILEIGDGVIQVVSTNGNNHLGGDDFDKRVVDWLADNFRKAHGVDLRNDRQALQRLYEAGEKSKIELSTKMETDISLPFITATAEGPLHLEAKLTRATLESLVRDLVESTRGPVENALRDAKLNASDINEVLLVGGMTRMPLVQQTIKAIFKKEGNKSINPDEAVAVGAAIQSSILSGEMGKDVVLVDVTPLTLGVEVKGGLLEPIIERNTPIPVKKAKVFTTAEDNQTEVEVRVYQGERKIATQNHMLGSFRLVGIMSAPRNIPQIEVSFDIDTDGIVNVNAKDLGTGKEQGMVVTGRNKLDPTEINKMVEDAKRNEEEDNRRKQEIEMKNQADHLVYSIEKILRESGDKIPGDLRSKVESLKNDLRDAVNKENMQRIKVLMDALNLESMKMGAFLYKQPNASPDPNDVQTGGQSGPNPEDGNTYTAEYEDVQ